MLRFKGETNSGKRRKHQDRDQDKDKPRNRSRDRKNDQSYKNSNDDYRNDRSRSRSRTRSRSRQRRDSVNDDRWRRDRSRERQRDDYGKAGKDRYDSRRTDHSRSRSRSPRRRDPFELNDKKDSADIPAGDAKEFKKKKKERKPKIAPTTEPMIIVTVNDRLGTKASIPCLASDPIKSFKALVAAQIGREPHEIMLKRQGERPFKDNLTLEDYGVSNGVQLDLEVDTGD